MSECKDGGECGLGGYCDDCYQVVIAEKDERIKQLEAQLNTAKAYGIEEFFLIMKLNTHSR